MDASTHGDPTDPTVDAMLSPHATTSAGAGAGAGAGTGTGTGTSGADAINSSTTNCNVRVDHSQIPSLGLGCFSTIARPEGVIREANGNVWRLPVVTKMLGGTQKELHASSEWENDKALVGGRRVNKYWPMLSSLLCSDQLVVFDEDVLVWCELVDRGYTFRSAYPSALQRCRVLCFVFCVFRVSCFTVSSRLIFESPSRATTQASS